MKLRIFGKGFNYSQDGQGNRLVYHLLGCNMRCPWCSNPEGMSFDGENTEIEVSSLVSEAVRSKMMFFDGGGVTFTGGEATCQHEALREALSMLKDNGIDTALETNGTSGRFSELLPCVDHLITDLKHPDDLKCRDATGVGNENTKKNIALALSCGKDTLVRIPLINGFNNDPQALSDFVSFFREINNEHLRVEVLKYHEYGRDKWKKLGLEYRVENGFVTDNERDGLEDMLKNAGISVVRT